MTTHILLRAAPLLPLALYLIVNAWTVVRAWKEGKQ